MAYHPCITNELPTFGTCVPHKLKRTTQALKWSIIPRPWPGKAPPNFAQTRKAQSAQRHRHQVWTRSKQQSSPPSPRARHGGEQAAHFFLPSCLVPSLSLPDCFQHRRPNTCSPAPSSCSPRSHTSISPGLSPLHLFALHISVSFQTQDRVRNSG